MGLKMVECKMKQLCFTQPTQAEHYMFVSVLILFVICGIFQAQETQFQQDSNRSSE